MSLPTDILVEALRKHHKEYLEEHGSDKGVWNIFKSANISGASIGRIVSGITKIPKMETWDALYLTAPEIIPRPPWFADPVPPVMKADLNNGQSAANQGKESEHTTIPLAKQKVSAGNGHLIIETEKICDLAFRRDWLAKRGGTYKKVVLPVSGDSMEPVIAHGDVVLVDQSEDGKVIRNGQIYVVNDVDNGVFVKQVYQEKTGIQLVSYNKEYPPCFLPVPEGVVSPIIGRVIWWAHAVDPD